MSLLPRRVALETGVVATVFVTDLMLSCVRGTMADVEVAILLSLAGVLYHWRPLPALACFVVGLGTLAIVPPSHVALSIYLPLVAVVFRLQDGAVRLAVAITLGGAAAGLWTSRRAGDAYQWGTACALWGVLYVFAWGLGRALWRNIQNTRAAHVAELTAQRRTIAAELHDNVAHELSLMVMRAESGRQSPHTAAAELEEIARSGRRANEQLRNMMRLLQVQEHVRPLALTDALHDAQERLTAAGIAANASIEGDLDDISPTVADCLARVVREAINNVVRHADKTWPCAMFVEVSDGGVRLAILNRRAHPSRPPREGLGLDGMTQRVAVIGGTVWAGPQQDMWLVRVDAPCAV